MSLIRPWNHANRVILFINPCRSAIMTRKRPIRPAVPVMAVSSRNGPAQQVSMGKSPAPRVMTPTARFLTASNAILPRMTPRFCRNSRDVLIVISMCIICRQRQNKEVTVYLGGSCKMTSCHFAGALTTTFSKICHIPGSANTIPSPCSKSEREGGGRTHI